MEESREVNEGQLAPIRQRAVTMLASGMRGKDVAANLQIRPETLSRWRSRDDQFANELRRLQQDLHESNRARLADL